MAWESRLIMSVLQHESGGMHLLNRDLLRCDFISIREQSCLLMSNMNPTNLLGECR